jgi:hypothetical protein
MSAVVLIHEGKSRHAVKYDVSLPKLRSQFGAVCGIILQWHTTKKEAG